MTTTPHPSPDDARAQGAYAQTPTPMLLATSREIAEEIVRRVGFDEACRQTKLSEAEMRQLLEGANPFPGIALPPGTISSDDWLSSGNEFRVFHAADRVILSAEGRKIGEVCATGVQYADGHIGTTLHRAPTIAVYTDTDYGLTSQQARELAAALLEAAAEIDGWTTK